jgi:hypothetical protein
MSHPPWLMPFVLTMAVLALIVYAVMVVWS